MTIPLPPVAVQQSLEKEAELFRRSTTGQAIRPFQSHDTTAGMEYELQVAVEGSSEHVDLPLSIKNSSYFRNVIKRSLRGDCPEQTVSDLKQFLEDTGHNVWENSWVRMKTGCLSNYAARLIEHDFLADKRHAQGPLRGDRHLFFTVHRGEQWLRLPISYILKLALADFIGRSEPLNSPLKQTAEKLLEHFISDNTSPEILSLSLAAASQTISLGQRAAQEAARTYVIAQLLIQYANSQFGLRKNGQRAMVYFAPQAPLRQKRINDLVPDSFYRQLFMSPCLSGWDRGEEKHEYMALCHRTLSRSQLNTITKLREAGILINNLVVMPNTSNTCLANNGIHVSLGSNVLSGFAADPGFGFTPAVEKYFGDLVIKIIEHFLPLLVTTCSAAPYRIAFTDFHPEKVLGFLPHELDYTQLRMLWRRWKKKADISIFGKPLTPFGPPVLDRLIAALARVHGDLVPDFRLIDYLVALLSTETSPALDGRLGNQDLLKQDLAEMGVFDARMAIYLPYRMRDFLSKGYSGFEGRFYSLFPSLLEDMSTAVNLQNLITAFAYRLVLEGKVRHADIPDTPNCESERRQIFFATATGIPTVFIEKSTRNRFLSLILGHVDQQRNSRRYKGYTRIKVVEYQRALIKILREAHPEVSAEPAGHSALNLIQDTISSSDSSAAGRLTRATLASMKEHRSALSVPADQFNLASESYYRTELRLKHLEEGISVLLDDCRSMVSRDAELTRHIAEKLGLQKSLAEFIEQSVPALISESARPETLREIMMICLAAVHCSTTSHDHVNEP